MESNYERDPATSPIAIHPYPKHRVHGQVRRRPDQEARRASDADARVRYQDFFGHDEGASRSA